jgi:hypothetical protein
MFINEFFFSFSILVFTGGLMILGTVLLVDAFRRLSLEWLSRSSRRKPTSAVLAVDTKRSFTKNVRDSAGNLIQQRVAMTDEEIS